MTLYYTGFSIFQIKETKSGFFMAELGNGTCVSDRNIETVKAVLKAFEKLNRSAK